MTVDKQRVATDLTWLLLLGGTGLLWLVFDRREGSTVTLLMTIMVVKSALIGAVFMNLWRASRFVLGLLVAAMALTAVAIIRLA